MYIPARAISQPHEYNRIIFYLPKRITKARKYEKTKKTGKRQKEKCLATVLPSSLSFFVVSFFRAFVILFSFLRSRPRSIIMAA
jgi:hypothetical protein